MRVLRGLAGRVLGCGCLLGIYEMYGGEIVATVDAKGPDCTDPQHVKNNRLPVPPHLDPQARAAGPSGPDRRSG